MFGLLLLLMLFKACLLLVGNQYLQQGTTKINVAVDKLPQFSCFKLHHQEVGPHHTAQAQIGAERYLLHHTHFGILFNSF